MPKRDKLLLVTDEQYDTIKKALNMYVAVLDAMNLKSNKKDLEIAHDLLVQSINNKPVGQTEIES